MLINKCVICNKEFEAQKITKKYCSRSCQNKARTIRVKNQALATKQGIDLNIKQCLICGKSFKPVDKNANQRTCCYDCMPQGVQLQRSGFLDLLRKQRGGKCQRCGYSAYLGALDFHHIEQQNKDFTIGNRDFRLAECIEESKKCVLICANCHREIHNGLWNINEILTKEEVNLEFDFD